MSGIYALKPWFVRRLRSLEDVFVEHRVGPNSITIGAVVVGSAAGAAIAGGAAPDRSLVWLAVLPLGVIRLALNELGDRACDLAMFGPLISVGPVWLVMATVAAMTLTSTAGVMALAVTGRRDTSGPMGKADRVLLLGVAALIAAFVDSDVPFVIAMVAVILGCTATVSMRLGRFPKEAGDVRQ